MDTQTKLTCPAGDELQKRDKEISSLSRFVFVVIAFTCGVAIMAIAVWLYSREDLRDPTISNWLGAISVQILVSMGTSIFSAVTFFLIYSHVAERRMLRELTNAAAEYSISLFTNKFEKMLPIKVFPESDLPTEEFDLHFDKLSSDSMTYRHKGDTASFASFRLSCLYDNKSHLDKDIAFLLVDPRETKILQERAQIELTNSRLSYSKQELDFKVEELRTEIFVTLLALFDISHRITVEVAFHKELVFFRSEILDGGIFITYYLGGKFPGTYLYSRSTFPYDAFLLNFRQNYDAASLRVTFNIALTAQNFQNLLNDLGCNYTIDQLRGLKEDRFKKFTQMKQHTIRNVRAPISTNGRPSDAAV